MCHSISKNCSLGVGNKKLHSNKSTPSFNCKICGTIEFLTSLYYSCAMRHSSRDFRVDSSGNTLLGVHGSSSTRRDFEVSSLERKRRGSHFLLKLSISIHRRRKARTV